MTRKFIFVSITLLLQLTKIFLHTLSKTAVYKDQDKLYTNFITNFIQTLYKIISTLYKLYHKIISPLYKIISTLSQTLSQLYTKLSQLYTNFITNFIQTLYKITNNWIMESEQTNKYRSDITHGFKVAHSNILGYYIMTTYTNHITINTLLTHY